MQNKKNIIEQIESNDFEKLADRYYGSETELVRKRYIDLLEEFENNYSSDEVHIFSSPGRTEICGNHTDHNNGLVLAAAINYDTLAVVSKRDDKIVNLTSKGFDEIVEINLEDLNPRVEEKEKSSSLLRGVAKYFQLQNWNIGGFNAFVTSDVLVGSGLSSSASFEVLIGKIFSDLYNMGEIDPIEIAKAGQYAENNYFGKPCGLMDQIACAIGGIVGIDFERSDNPKVQKLNIDYETFPYKFMIVNTGGNHADLTGEYASIPLEMKKIASIFGKETCRELNPEEVKNNIGEIRSKCGDRALLRCLHFFEENKRVEEQINSLVSGNYSSFLNAAVDSGNSSFKFLQNCYVGSNSSEQGISIALNLSESFIKKIGEGASRVHGGGFAGTVLSLIPVKEAAAYKLFMEKVFGPDSVITLKIRDDGVSKVY